MNPKIGDAWDSWIRYHFWPSDSQLAGTGPRSIAQGP